MNRDDGSDVAADSTSVTKPKKYQSTVDFQGASLDLKLLRNLSNISKSDIEWD